MFVILKHSLPFLMLALTVLGLPVEAWAQQTQTGPDMVGQTEQVARQISDVPKLLAVFSYVAGTVLSVKGLLSLRRYISDPDQNPLGIPMGLLIAAALLIFLPYLAGLFMTSQNSGNFTIDSAAKGFIEKGIADPNAKDLRDAQYSMSKSIYRVPKFVAILSYACGVFFAASGLVKLKDWINDADRNPLNPAIFRLVTAALMIAFPHVLLVATASFFAHGSGANASVEVDVTTSVGMLKPFKKLQ
jgi:intracellular multiplication protein IcmD